MTKLALNILAQLPNVTVEVKEDISLTGIIGIFGHSGAGKSTLLKAIAGINNNITGSISLGDAVIFNHQKKLNLAPNHRNIIGVFQQDTLFPHLNVLDNILYGRKRLARPKFNENDIISAAGISHLLPQKVTSLSGGEKQKVAIVQAILAEPNLLILDEPVSALDGKNKQQILHLIKTLQQQTNMPVLFVSHNIQEHQVLCDQLYIMEQGQFIAHGNVKEMIRQLNCKGIISPQTYFTADILSKQKHGLIELSLNGDMQLFAMENKLNLVTNTIQCYLLASDVSVCISQPNNSSIVNQLSGQIIDISINQHQALLSINCHNHVFYSAISTYSLNKLKLQQGSDIYIQFKASAIGQVNF